MPKARDRLVRFWEKVRVTDAHSCWEWTGRTYPFGYGCFDLAHDVAVGAHRFAWELANGAISGGLWVLHRCDNPRCVNPSHLFLGTATDNNRDKAAKGRHHNQNKAACIRGHTFSAENTAVRRDGRRYCRTCFREADRLRKRRAYAAGRNQTLHLQGET